MEARLGVARTASALMTWRAVLTRRLGWPRQIDEPYEGASARLMVMRLPTAAF